MNKQEYLNLLSEENKQCKCKYLTRFFFLKEKFNELENLCNDLQDCFFISGKISPKNRENYGQKNYGRIGFYNELNRELNLLIKKRKINLHYCNEKNNYEKEQINSRDGKKLKKKNKIITASCYKCSQQIGVLQ